MTTETYDEKSDSSATSPGESKVVREVILPDPLPSYIKRVERPTGVVTISCCDISMFVKYLFFSVKRIFALQCVRYLREL